LAPPSPGTITHQPLPAASRIPDMKITIYSWSIRWLRWKRIGVRIARKGIESVEEFLLPTLSAVRGGGDAPYLLRLVDTMATQCHRARLLRSCAQPFAFS
ncbi:hypothetical protein ACFYYI_42300, partial [Streptomyces sp. NPDC002387]